MDSMDYMADANDDSIIDLDTIAGDTIVDNSIVTGILLWSQTRWDDIIIDYKHIFSKLGQPL